MRIQQPRDGFVRLDHEHLDQRVREALSSGIASTTFLSSSTRFASPADRARAGRLPGGAFGCAGPDAFMSLQQLRRLGRIIGDLSRRRRDAESSSALIDDRLGFAVSQALGGS